MNTNDNEPSASGISFPTPDAHGKAALLLIESLIHGLCEHSVLSVGQAIEIGERAVDVQFDQAEEADGAGAPLWQSHALLAAIVASLQIDRDDGPPQPSLAT